MTTERYLSKQLQKFSILDLTLVKLVYLVFGILIFSLYSELTLLSWWFYFALALLCNCPLLIHLFSQKGPLVEKIQKYIKTNNPSNQVLLFLNVFFLALMLCTLIPVLASASWWVYVILMIITGIKPLTTTWVW